VLPALLRPAAAFGSAGARPQAGARAAGGARAPSDPRHRWRFVPHAEICVQDDAIDAIVAAAQQVLVEGAQLIPARVQLPRRPPQTVPQGPLFHSAVCEKA
jgi:hypothetical protein